MAAGHALDDGSVRLQHAAQQGHKATYDALRARSCLQVDGFFLRRCKQGTVQFVLLKPVMAALVLIMYAAGTYTDGDMSPHNGYAHATAPAVVCGQLAEPHSPSRSQRLPASQNHPQPCAAPRRYFYISIMYNICYTLALYGLILFWNGASELLQPFNPLLKFVLVKTVVFLTFWQVGPALATTGTTQP